MKIEGTQELQASRTSVYAALTNPQVLQRCIPGCESLDKTGEDAYAVTIRAGIGAIKGTFKGSVRLEDMRPSEHYRIVVEGKGGPGFVKGSGDFDLEEKAGGTLITYRGDLQVGGAIAGIGQRMIEGAAKMMAARFFAALEVETKAPHTAPPS